MTDRVRVVHPRVRSRSIALQPEALSASTAVTMTPRMTNDGVVEHLAILREASVRRARDVARSLSLLRVDGQFHHQAQRFLRRPIDARHELDSYLVRAIERMRQEMPFEMEPAPSFA